MELTKEETRKSAWTSFSKPNSTTNRNSTIRTTNKRNIDLVPSASRITKSEVIFLPLDSTPEDNEKETPSEGNKNPCSCFFLRNINK